MKRCKNCGQEIFDEMEICPICGENSNVKKQIDKNQNPDNCNANKTQRQSVYEGMIYKCPYCGEPLKSFTTICPACNKEIRGGNVINSLNDFLVKMDCATSEKEKIHLIKIFPIPNSREDIIEFMIIALSNFDSSYYASHLLEDDVSDAWLVKIEQCYQKAKFSFGEQVEFKKIEEMYQKIREECQKKIQNNIEQKKRELRLLEAEAFRKSKFSIGVIVLMSIAAILAAAQFYIEEIVYGVIAAFSSIQLALSFLMGMGVIKTKERFTFLAFTVLGFLVLLVVIVLLISGLVNGR